MLEGIWYVLRQLGSDSGCRLGESGRWGEWGRVGESQFPIPDSQFPIFNSGVADLRYERLNMQVIESCIHKDSGFSTYFFHPLIKQRLNSQFPILDSNFLLLVDAIEQRKSPHNPDKVGNSSVSIGEYHKYV